MLVSLASGVQKEISSPLKYNLTSGDFLYLMNSNSQQPEGQDGAELIPEILNCHVGLTDSS